MHRMDDPPDVSAELKSFLRGWITSYEQLQTLLLLRQRRDGSLTTQSVAAILSVSESTAAEALEHLRRASLIEVLVARGTASFKYAPASIHLADLVDQLVDAWDLYQLTIMTLMSSNAIDRVRTGAIRTFADAFILGKKKTDG